MKSSFLIYALQATLSQTVGAAADRNFSWPALQSWSQACLNLIDARCWILPKHCTQAAARSEFSRCGWNAAPSVLHDSYRCCWRDRAVQLDSKARADYVEAFRQIVTRIAAPLKREPASVLPIRMYVAGGAALHFYTGERVSRDVDAVFSRRIALPDNLDIAYRDADGAARLLYFDRQYSDSLSLMHEDAQNDSIPLSLEGIDAGVLDVRLLAPLDLAVSKISRFSEHDRNDIASLARHKLIGSAALRQRAKEALAGYVGSVDRVRGSIESACRIVEDVERRRER